MQTVFRADDGTIFEKEIDCEKYEDKLKDREALFEVLASSLKNETFAHTVIGSIESIVESGKGHLFTYFIKSIGEQDANQIN